MSHPTIDELTSLAHAREFIWHPTFPQALARASVELDNLILRLVSQGMRAGATFRFALPATKWPEMAPSNEPVSFEEIGARILTFRIEEFSSGQSVLLSYAARFEDAKDLDAWLEAYPDLRLS